LEWAKCIKTNKFKNNPLSAGYPYGGEYDEAHKKYGHLSNEEFSAVNMYTSEDVGYSHLNKVLREDGFIPKATQSYIDVLDSSLDNIKDTKGTFYRGMLPTRGGETRKAISDLKVGSIWEDKGYFSTSRDKQKAGSFGNIRFSNAGEWLGNITEVTTGVLFKVKGSGDDISKLSAAPREQEVLFSRGSKFKVLSKKQREKVGGGVLIEIELEEIAVTTKAKKQNPNSLESLLIIADRQLVTSRKKSKKSLTNI